MEMFEGYKVPAGIYDENLENLPNMTQDDICDMSPCLDESEIDCGDCLFSSKHCPFVIFNDWKDQKRESHE